VPTPAAPPVQTGAAIIGIDPPPGTLALTFDDGPFVGWTEEILSLLDDHDVTATFFISTYLLPGNEYLISQIVAAGHSVQTHGDQHIDPTTRTADEVRIDLQTSIDKIVAAGAPRPVCFRPPFGMTGLVVESVAAELGLTVLTWNLNSLDYSFQEPTGVINRVLDQAGAGSVVLMHDQWAPIHRTTLAAIIPELRARGLEFSPLCTTSG
jgi:peptidoglycan/xylan/chitin deacetylase (PgdA/CDA1 family)